MAKLQRTLFKMVRGEDGEPDAYECGSCHERFPPEKHGLNPGDLGLISIAWVNTGPRIKPNNRPKHLPVRESVCDVCFQAIWLETRSISSPMITRLGHNARPICRQCRGGGYAICCPNCDGIRIRGRLRRQELYCFECRVAWPSPFLLRREHFTRGHSQELSFSIKYDGFPRDDKRYVVRSVRRDAVPGISPGDEAMNHFNLCKVYLHS